MPARSEYAPVRGLFLAIVLVTLGNSLGGCAADVTEIGREPRMTAVGSGLDQEIATPSVSSAPFPLPAYGGRSLWSSGRGELFRDQRAMRAGDVLTVSISINDRASLGNTSDRSKEAKISNNMAALFNLFGWTKSGTLDVEVDSKSSTKGQGNIDRSEKIQLSIAAIVTQVLSNGNLLISGSQEIRVNYELRLLNIAGIVRPTDIARDNTISYDKIAEARVSYGGRGRSMEVQQPNWGQQIYDLARPF
ncbi:MULTISPECIES: flagellar basal body L-ring protein FlgH [unclassified Beijerinckia]|uniref:flagellar basal body L-ring protein FlgH n=1 Tax=unclassified Beijerinckia TaxID=2638183 RepID=UPI0008965A7A|nr:MULTISPECIES: flagellar basal body L-ring protein FlgH [unclassified Beijerinckia]MDH7798649.1 flagellar L-ring protein precursor FlgH [Beijerinckia sp. GAS462]SED27970.1 flagellar L-ring protein precursor FlgH [Beijerinckia sp. 28-YEA-48]